MQIFKIKSLKKISVIVAAIVGISSYQSAQAAPLNVSARVSMVGAMDPTQNPSPNSLTLVGVNSLGNCAVYGPVWFRMKDDLRGQQMYATALAAALSGATVTVGVDDTYRDGAGFCYVISIFVNGN